MTLSLEPSTLAVLLCAGLGSRFADDRHKLLADLDGITVFERAVASARASHIGPILVITGAVELPVIAGVAYARNERFADGQGGSLRLALDVAHERDFAAVVCGLGDQPFIEPDSWAAVALEKRTPIAVATYGGRRRNPVRLAAQVWPLIDGSGDYGARQLMALRPELVTEVACAGFDLDVDTLEDLQAAKRLLAEQGN